MPGTYFVIVRAEPAIASAHEQQPDDRRPACMVESEPRTTTGPQARDHRDRRARHPNSGGYLSEAASPMATEDQPITVSWIVNQA